MRGKVFLIHWNEQEVEDHAETLRSWGWEVETEAEDGARACKTITAHPPDAVVIFLTRLPSHGRETARYLRSRKATSQLPIIFVDGSSAVVEKMKSKIPSARYTSSKVLEIVLGKYAD
jgi:DNA-binding response OmpR family regulator